MITPLESIRACFEGVIPSPFATCGADGVPNVSYMSIVQYVDTERVALSQQFLNKSRVNLDANPQAQVRVVEPETLVEYLLDLRYLHTETDGPVFDAVCSSLEAIARQSGLGDVFRLRGVDIHRVLECRPVGTHAPVVPRRELDAVQALDELARRLGQATDYATATRVALQALEDLFGFRHAILLGVDERRDRLFAIADNGYPQGAAGAEVPAEAGLIGVALQRRRVVHNANLARGRIMGTAVGGAQDIPLPALEGAQSAAALPLLVRGELTGVLYLESERAGTFSGRHERLLRLIAAQLAATLALLEADRREDAAGPAASAAGDAGTVAVTYYQADDSVFVDGEYVIRGVPGRILWRLLVDHARDGRTTFTNRELRLDERLGLAAGADNLEARLLVLRRRLADVAGPIGLERVGRGRLGLTVRGALELSEVPTTGPMRAAHAE